MPIKERDEALKQEYPTKQMGPPPEGLSQLSKLQWGKPTDLFTPEMHNRYLAHMQEKKGTQIVTDALMQQKMGAR